MAYAFDLALVAGGYVLSVFTWAKIRTWIVGAETEIAALQAKAKALKAAL